MRRFRWRRYLRRPRHEWTLLFVHVPKTAGTTLRDALSQVYLPREQLFLYDSRGLGGAVHPTEFAALPEDERASRRFIAGHFYYGLHRDVPRPARYVTVVRDSVDRVASLYDHYRRIAELQAESRAGSEGRRILDDGLSLEEWGFGLGRIEIDNEIVRHVSARDHVPFGKCPDDMLQEALEHVDEHFAEVLIVERMHESLKRLEAQLGVGLPVLERLNANERRTPAEQIDPGLVARIRELNHLDEAFYRAMNERLS